MASRTETDNRLPRVTSTAYVLKQVLPQGTEQVLPRWLIEREHPIGREVDCDLGVCLAGDSKASKKHALLICDGEGVRIKDCGSKNHTFVNGRPVSSASVGDNDVIRIGATLFVLRRERVAVTDAPKREHAVHERLLGQSAEISVVRQRLSLAARSVETVLLSGPTGVGKELAASAVHTLSARSGRPLISVNCAAITAGTAESALFGHKRGAFTGAERDHDGFFKQADTGTLFLDEIGDLSPELQAKLLRALQPADPGRAPPAGKNPLRIQPAGSQSELTVDVRIIAATNVELAQAAEAGRFRADLYQRLCVLPVQLPALAQRREDILLLLHHYLNLDSGGDARRVGPALAELLLLYDWPGNVRQMVNLSKRLVMFASSHKVIDLDILPEDFVLQLVPHAVAAAAPDESSSSPSPITKEVLARLLKENRGLVSRVARILGRSPRQVRRRMEQFGLLRPQGDQGAAGRSHGTDQDEGGSAADDEDL